MVRSTYGKLQEQLRIPIFTERSVFRILKHPAEENTWLGRTADPLYQHYVENDPSVGAFNSNLNPYLSAGEIKLGGQVNLPLLIKTYQNFLSENEQITFDQFDYEQLKIGEQIRYKNLEAKKIIFCEGAAADRNPFFNYLPFELSKGEALEVDLPEGELEKIIRHKISLVPFGGKKFWVGSANSWDFEDDLPTDLAKAELEGHLKELLSCGYEITAHKAAIRPTVKDRRPFLGSHPKHPNLLIFNGLGTKGASLAPYLAEQLVGFILDESPIEKEVDIGRYFSHFQEEH